jgi:5-methylcytosine-specific restriction endonuclease McrA
MSDGAIVTDRLDSWKEIASYINRSVRTVIRWESQKSLPVHRIPGGQRQNVYA